MTLAYIFPPFRLLPSRRQLLREDAPVKLGGRAFDVLVALVERHDRIVAKSELIDLVWPQLVVEENNLQVQVASLRKLLGHPAVATVPGRGYRFTLPTSVVGVDERINPRPNSDAGLLNPELRPSVASSPRTLYGRDEDLRQLREWLDLHRLITIAGPGGIGKTRLAQALARSWTSPYAGAAWWIDLASLADPSLLPHAVAQVMGLDLPAAGDAMAPLVAALPREPTLLVMDSAEHLLGAVVNFVAQVQAQATNVSLLVTSQEILRVAGEVVFRPEPLALPDSDDPERVAASGAVTLFVARARAADRRFELNAGNQAAVAEICRRLDGIPLAIELAAARVPLLGIDGVRTKLDQRFELLTTGNRGALRRHQTLRGALEWSHQLLAVAEQAVLRRLGTFSGGFTLEAAQQVADDDRGIDAWDVLDYLGALVDKSLVVVDGEHQPRYRLLESTRLFALERLIASGEVAAVSVRHRDHFLALAEEARDQMLVADPRGLARLDVERDNLFLALACPHGDEDGSKGLRLAAAMRSYWTARGMIARGLAFMLAALDRPQAQLPSTQRCRVLGDTAQLYLLTGNLVEASRHARLGVQMARLLSDESSLCGQLVGCGFVHLAEGDINGSLSCVHEALDLGRRVGDSLELGNALSLRAELHSRAGEHAAARQTLEAGVALRRRLNHLPNAALGELHLAQLAVNANQAEAALPHLLRALELLTVVDSRHVGLHLIGMTAEWAAARGLNEASVLLDAACAALHRRVGMADPLDPAQLERFERARAALDEATRTRLIKAGHELSYDEAVEEVRERLQATSNAARV